jgi:hypothetical protein
VFVSTPAGGLASQADRDVGLRAFVREQRVSAEIAPHFDIDERHRVQTAFDLSLFAARPAACRGDPACDACQAAWERLAELARSVLPPEAHYRLEPFDASFHLRRESGWEPEVELVVQILPRDLGPGLERVDEAARDTVARVQGALDALGVARGVWRAARGARPR